MGGPAQGFKHQWKPPGPVCELPESQFDFWVSNKNCITLYYFSTYLSSKFQTVFVYRRKSFQGVEAGGVQSEDRVSTPKVYCPDPRAQIRSSGGIPEELWITVNPNARKEPTPHMTSFGGNPVWIQLFFYL